MDGAKIQRASGQQSGLFLSSHVRSCFGIVCGYRNDPTVNWRIRVHWFPDRQHPIFWP